MGRWFWFGFTGLLIAGLLTGGYAMFTPKIGHATPAAIEAVLPASLKVRDVPDSGAEARYERLIEILKGIDRAPISSRSAASMALPATLPGKSTPGNEAVLKRIEALLDEGGLRVPPRDPNGASSHFTALKDAANVMRLAIQSAQKRGDKAACLRWSELGLRYADALRDSRGVVMDALVGIAINAIVDRAIYLAEISGGYDAMGRVRLLELLKPEDGGSAVMAEAVRRDFQSYWMPLLLNPEPHVKDLAVTGEYDYNEPPPESKLAGTFDPVDTARLGGKLYDALIEDLRRPFAEARHPETKILAEAENGLPRPAFTGPEGYWYRIRMNLGKNTLGRQGLATSVLTQLGEAAARDATTRNVLRAVMLLRSGQSPQIPDPFGKGYLRFDKKRNIVWSVGKDGKDDGGAIGLGWDNRAMDQGYPYGDHSWPPPRAPLLPGGYAGPPPGMPPPIPGP